MSDNKETKQAWAPDRIWLQRGVGDDGSHTWCSDSQDEHEQAEYVRVDVQAPAVEAGARDEREDFETAMEKHGRMRPFTRWPSDDSYTDDRIEWARRGWLAALARASEVPRFTQTFCSQCGKEFGPGNHGFSHCESHHGKV